MTIQQFVEKARKGGFIAGWTFAEYHPNYMFWASWVLLQPEAWKAVGKVEGWGECPVCGPALSTKGICDSCRDTPLRLEWRDYMYRMIGALIDGCTIEQFLETL